MTRVVAGFRDDVHTAGDIDPGELSNIPAFLAFEWTQVELQSFSLNDAA